MRCFAVCLVTLMMVALACQPEAQLGETLECPWDQSDPTLRTFLFAGQSNMVAAGGARTAFPAEFAEGSEQLRMFDDGAWKPLALPAVGRWGPEISFAWTMHAACPESNIGIIKHAVGGTSIDTWVPTAENGRELGRLATEAFVAEPSLSFEGFVFMQGGADMRTRERAESWGEDYLSIVDHVRGAWVVPNDLPFLHGTYRFGDVPDDVSGIDPDSVPSPRPRRPFAVHLTVEQWDVQYERPGIYPVAMRELPVLADGIHWTPDGIRTAGRNFAQRYANSG